MVQNTSPDHLPSLPRTLTLLGPTKRRVGSGNPFMAGSPPHLGSQDDLFHLYLDMEKVGSECEMGSHPTRETKHRQSLPVGTLGLGLGEAKKAMAPEKLAELAVVDPKRAKRILANRQSAARSKERKAHYISELESRVQTLQIELTTLSAQLALLQRDTSGLATENNALKLRLQSMEQQAHLHDALNEALKNEVERLKIATGEAANSTDTYNTGLQLFQLDNSTLHRHQHQRQRQFSFHRDIQLSQPQCSHSQATFSNHQMMNGFDTSDDYQIVQQGSSTISPSGSSNDL